MELRLRGRDPNFVVTPPPAEPSSRRRPAATARRRRDLLIAEDGPAARINVRLPEQLKAAVEEAAAKEGRSVNAWLVRAAAAALQRSDRDQRPEPRGSGKRAKQRLHRLGPLATRTATPLPPTRHHHHEGTTMPTFDTPEPISVTLELGVGDVRITASDRTDTVVEVRPSDDADESDVQGRRSRSASTTPTARCGSPGRRRASSTSPARPGRSTCPSSCPAGSQVSADVQMGDIRSAGRLGECRFKTSAGNVRLERTGPLRLDTSAGHITVGAVAGNAEISTGTGKVQIGEVDGAAVVKNSNGDTEIDTVTGDVRVRAANGDIAVERAGAGVDAKTSNGNIRLGEVARGSVVLGDRQGRPGRSASPRAPPPGWR